MYLTQNEYTESRKKASDSIKAGNVFVDGKCVTKPAFEVTDDSLVDFKGESIIYVGRGGLKIEKALKEFSIDVSGYTCADIGSSTGGFTDCLLQNGALKVYAIDSGTNQLHDKLRNDKRVVCMEGVNARHIKHDSLGEKCDIVVMDVSFISQTLLYENVKEIIKNNGLFVSLIKPQFEAGRENIGKNGIVTNEKVRLSVCEKIINTAKEYGFKNLGITDSPINGGDGNKEYLALFKYE